MLSWQSAKKLALSLPEAQERDHFGKPAFCVRGKIFAQLGEEKGSQARALVKLSAADQAALTLSDPDTFSSVAHWGRYGWTYVQLARIDAAILTQLFLQSWRLVAPKSLVAAHPQK